MVTAEEYLTSFNTGKNFRIWPPDFRIYQFRNAATHRSYAIDSANDRLTCTYETENDLPFKHKNMEQKDSEKKLRHEQVQYIEFLSRDLAAVKSFYSASFGWIFTDYGPDYTAFEGDFVDGGFTTGEPVRGSILVVLYSDDILSTKEKVVNAGGIIEKDIFEFPGGRRFHFLDPDGNELAVWAE
jgi:predicted enzyme related to lactoylglutathione lyase